MVRLTFGNLGVVGILTAALMSTSASGQIPEQIFHQMLGTVQSMQRAAPPPTPDQRINPLAFPFPGSRNISSSKPTINCSNVQTPLPMILCTDPNAARADWDVNAAAWANLGQLDGEARGAFQKEQDGWVQSIFKTCKLDSTISESQRRCVIGAYRGRTNAVLARLSGDALDEARLQPEQRAELQARLVSLGLLHDEPDGEFGPNTRTAIRAFQQANGLPGTGFLSLRDRQLVLTTGRTGLSERVGVSPPVPGRVPETQATRFPTEPGNEAEAHLGQSGTPQPKRTTMVEVTGLGETADAARKDAARLAVQQVAGVYIDDRRRVDTKLSSERVSQIVEEKLLSYTNAYVSKFQPVSQECDDGNCKVVAKVTVNVAPLVQTLRASSVPTVEFDSNSAEAAATTLSAERADAFAAYKDLISRLDELIKVGVGKADVNASLPSASDSVWLSVPISFFVNPAASREWREKFARMADKHQQMPISTMRSKNASGCISRDIPSYTAPSLRQSSGAASTETACFISSTEFDFGGPGSGGRALAECFGRTFAREEGDSVSLQKRASTILLVVEFVDKDDNVVRSLPASFQNFPQIQVGHSRSTPQGSESAFFDYCPVGQAETGLFYGAAPNFGGDTIIFPPMGSRINALLNVKLPTDKVGQIARIRASLKNKSQTNDWSSR